MVPVCLAEAGTRAVEEVGWEGTDPVMVSSEVEGLVVAGRRVTGWQAEAETACLMEGSCQAVGWLPVVSGVACSVEVTGEANAVLLAAEAAMAALMEVLCQVETAPAAERFRVLGWEEASLLGVGWEANGLMAAGR